MPTVDEVISDIIGIVKDPKFGPAEVLKFLNRCNVMVARKAHFSDLLQDDPIEPDKDAFVKALPADYHYGLYDCWSNTHNIQIKVYDSEGLINRQLDRLDNNCPVIGVAEKGSTLYYQRQPSSAETLRLFYFKKPTDLTIGGVMPVYVPDDFHYTLYSYYCAWRIYERIEDGIEGDKVNTKYYKNEFYEALGDAVVFFKPFPEAPNHAYDELSLSSFY